MSERKEGWYWVRMPSAAWEPAHYESGEWDVPELISPVDESAIDVIGPRIPTPDEIEGWQLVPTHRPTIDMTEAGMNHVMKGQDYERAQACWMAMLAAAPRFGDDQ